MKSIAVSVVIILTIAVFATTQRFETIMDFLARATRFSGVVMYAKNGKVVLEKAYGFRDFFNEIPLKTTDIFELASVSKTFTAMVIMILKEQGALDFDDPVSKYLNIPYQDITIRHLLNHTSGLPDYKPIMQEHWDKTKVAGNRDILLYLNRYKLPALFKPGSNFAYSNTGYILLASIAEVASGIDFINLCRTLIFKKLGMTDTDIRTAEEKKAVKNFAIGYRFIPEIQKFIRTDSLPLDYTFWLGNRKGPGRVSSTAYDLLKWDQALYTEKLVKQSTLDEAFSPGTLNDGRFSNYGFGWHIKRDYLGNKIVWHDGENPGYKTEFIRFLNTKKTLVVLSNNAVSYFSNLIAMLILAVQE